MFLRRLGQAAPGRVVSFYAHELADVYHLWLTLEYHFRQLYLRLGTSIKCEDYARKSL